MAAFAEDVCWVPRTLSLRICVSPAVCLTPVGRLGPFACISVNISFPKHRDSSKNTGSVSRFVRSWPRHLPSPPRAPPNSPKRSQWSLFCSRVPKHTPPELQSHSTGVVFLAQPSVVRGLQEKACWSSFPFLAF